MPSLVVVADAAAAQRAGAGTNKPTELHASVRPSVSGNLMLTYRRRVRTNDVYGGRGEKEKEGTLE